MLSLKTAKREIFRVYSKGIEDIEDIGEKYVYSKGVLRYIYIYTQGVYGYVSARLSVPLWNAILFLHSPPFSAIRSCYCTTTLKTQRKNPQLRNKRGLSGKILEPPSHNSLSYAALRRRELVGPGGTGGPWSESTYSGLGERLQKIRPR